MGLDFSDDVTSSISLLYCLDQCNQHVTTWFERNLQLGNPEPSIEQVGMTIGEIPIGEIRYYKQCLEKYRVAMGMDARGYVPDAPLGLDSKLDGGYWRT